MASCVRARWLAMNVNKAYYIWRSDTSRALELLMHMWDVRLKVYVCVRVRDSALFSGLVDTPTDLRVMTASNCVCVPQLNAIDSVYL